MSAPSGGATSAPQCACTNISIMQLFHELKQQFPGVPDHVVSTTISSHCHDRSACQSRLQCEAKKYISHLYPSSSLAGGKKETKDVFYPQQCPNQLLITKEVNKALCLQVSDSKPQRALLSCTKLDENQNEDVIKDEDEEDDQSESEADSSDSLECKQQEYDNSCKECVIKDINANDCPKFQIIKSNKVTSELNKKLHINEKQIKQSYIEKNKDNKVKRPNTLDLPREVQLGGFNSNIHKESLSAPASLTDSPQKVQNKPDCVTCKCYHKCCDKSTRQPHTSEHHSGETFPLNVSVNLNCRMDVHPGGTRIHSQQEPWRGNYSNPSNITSVNLTVCTPTGAEDSSEARQRGFEGHVQITVSPASTQPPVFRGAPTMIPQPRNYMQDAHATSIDNLIRRQRLRLQCLQNALAAEKSRLATMEREINVLEGPPPCNLASRLRPDVQHLRKLCRKLTIQLDRCSTDGDFYENMYTGQRPNSLPMNYHGQQRQQQYPEEPEPPWQCHMCTFLNNAFLNKCEQCGMPRIILVRGDEEVRVEVTPGRNSKILHYQH